MSLNLTTLVCLRRLAVEKSVQYNEYGRSKNDVLLNAIFDDSTKEQHNTSFVDSCPNWKDDQLNRRRQEVKASRKQINLLYMQGTDRVRLVMDPCSSEELDQD